jgi:hypothetical protein
MQRRRLRQITLAILSWILFGYYWWLVSRRRLNPETLTALSILVAAVGVVWLITLFWIRHNKRLDRKSGNRRRSRRLGPGSLGVDTLGRIVERSGDVLLSQARYIEVDIDEELGLKRYHPFETAPMEVER